MSTDIHGGPISATQFFGGRERGTCIQLTDRAGTTSKDPGAGIFIQGRQEDVLACAKAIVAFFEAEPQEDRVSDTAKYAKIFRAAADRICPGQWGLWYDRYLARERVENPSATEVFDCSRDTFIANESSLWLRSHPVARMFEKCAEAEGSVSVKLCTATDVTEEEGSYICRMAAGHWGPHLGRHSDGSVHEWPRDATR